MRENLIGDLKAAFRDDKRVDRFIAFLESKEGEDFFSRNPSLEEINEKRRSLVPQSPLTREQMKAEWYADMLPEGKTIQEIEVDIVGYISDLILEKGFQWEDPHDMKIISEVTLGAYRNPQLSPFLSKKFNDSPERFQWLIDTVKEQLIAENQKATKRPPVEVATASDPTYPSAPPEQAETERAVMDRRSAPEPVEIPDRTSETIRKNLEQEYPEGPQDISQLSIEGQVFVSLQKMNLSRERMASALEIVIKHGPEDALPILKEFDPDIAQEIEPLIQMETERSGHIERILQRRLEENQ